MCYTNDTYLNGLTKENMKETDLYKPVKDLFEKMGYTVNGEVADMDVTAVRGDELIVVEMKTGFNVTLLLQAVKRQKITEHVYVAIPRPTYKKRFSQDFKDKEYLLRRLSLGLILVAMDCPVPYATIAIEPKPFHEHLSIGRNKKKKNKTLQEIEKRHGDHNVGGSNRTRIVTAYRENALRIAGLIENAGHITRKELVEAGCGSKTYYILKNNYYKWFRKNPDDSYTLTDRAFEEMEPYRELINILIFEHITKDNRIICLRKSKIGEYQILSEIARESIENLDYPDLYKKNLTKRFQVTREQIRASISYTVEIKGQPVGFWLLTEQKEEHWEDEVLVQKGFWLEHFFVHPEYRNIGVGRRMFSHLKITAGKTGVDRILAFTDLHVQGFFEHMGATQLETINQPCVPGQMMNLIEISNHER